MNPKMSGQLQGEWHWLIAIYLFLGGVGSGAYVLAALSVILGGSEWAKFTDVALALSFPLLAIGSIFLLLDLGAPQNAPRVINRPGTSWISRGALIITAFMAVSFIHFAGQVWPLDFAKGASGRGLAVALSIVGLVLAFATMAYTGVLLGASKGMPFWRTGVLPALFFVSAVATGAMAVMLGMVAAKSTAIPLGQFRQLALIVAVLILVEFMVLFFFLHLAHKLPDSRESVVRLLANPQFVLVDLILGLALPMVLFGIVYLGAPEAGVVRCLVSVSCILGLIGGLVLRHGVLGGGYLTTLNAAGFEFRRVERPKEGSVLLGKLPPS